MGTIGRSWPRILATVALCGVGAELLSGYGPSTGHAGQVLLALVFFAALYGAPALLAREVARRRGWGWPGLLLMMAALGVAQCCVIDQSLFSEDYQGYDGWQEAREATWLPWLGTSAYNASNFVLGHTIFSFAAPIAVAEAWRPEQSNRPWLNRWGIAAALIAYTGSAAMILGDAESRSASPSQLAASVGVIAALVCAAVWVGVRSTTSPEVDRSSVGWRTVAAVAVLLGAVVECVPPNWLGVALYLAAASAGAWLLWMASASSAWTFRHTAAVGFGFLFARGLLAFLGTPVGGEVTPTLKYTHNTVMLVVVVITAGCYAFRRRPNLVVR